MAVAQTSFFQVGLPPQEVQRVKSVRDALLQHLNTPQARSAIEAANQPGSSSALIQETFSMFAESLGFTSEARGLFSEYATAGLRPDYFMSVGDSGILIEVERGKTTINNMDLLDLWKCHVCKEADYLFLMVPQALRQNDQMRPRNEYEAVVKRMSTFFLEGNYTNVRGLVVFGY